MRIQVNLIGAFHRSAPGNEEEFELNLGPEATIQSLLDHLGIDPVKHMIILINGRPAQKEQTLSEADRVTLLSGVEGG